MKKSLLGLAALTGLMLTSCDLNTKDSTSSITAPAFNMIIPLDGGEPIISSSPCFYSFDSNLTKMTVSVTGNPLNVDNTTYSFTTESAPYQPYSNYSSSTGSDQTTQDSGKVVSLGNVIPKVTGTMTPGNLPVKNGTFYYNTSIILPTLSWVPQHEGLMYSGQSYPVSLIASYQIGDKYLVRTFNTDTFYKGITRTSYKNMTGQDEYYENKEMLYRVLINLKDNTATLLLYNTKFSNSNKEPNLQAISIPGLKVTFKSGSYSIEGENITPLVYEGGGLTENKSFLIKGFRMSTQGEYMVDVTMNYEVEHTMSMGSGDEARDVTVTYNGVFMGASATLPGVSSL